MSRYLLLFVFLLGSLQVLAEEEAENASDTPGEEKAEVNGDGISSPKTLSGMSILGNEETPKSLVIVPWKSSETLDDRATPVDKEVFLRELRYYEIRTAE